MKRAVSYKKEYLSGTLAGQTVAFEQEVASGEKQHSLYNELVRKESKKIVSSEDNGDKFLVSSPQKIEVEEQKKAPAKKKAK